MRRTLVTSLLFCAALSAVSSIPTDDAAQRAERAAVSAPSAVVVGASSARDLDGIVWYGATNGYAMRARDDALGALTLEPLHGARAADTVARLMALPGVRYVEPLVPVTTADVPADPLYVSRQQAYLSAISAPAARDIEKGQPGIIVAVLDTGIDLDHPDLERRIWTNVAEVPSNGLDDDKNGCIDDVHGCAFLGFPTEDCDRAANGEVDDDVGHGTFVSGIIAAEGNGRGMVGVARGVTILPVKSLDCAGGGTSFELAQGILYAARNGARVINISSGSDVDAAIIREAVRSATDEYGALVVAAAGNTGAAGVFYPARYPEVLAVGAASIKNPNVRATFSTTGPEVDVVAVGESILGPVPRPSCRVFLPCIGGEPYATGDGTSFAAPQVAGLAALILSRRPFTTPATLHEAIRASADPVPAGDRPNWAGAGRVNMLKALRPPYRLGTPGLSRN